MLLKVEVTQEDIDRGSPFVTVSCPISLACYRIFSPGLTISSTPCYIRVFGHTSPETGEGFFSSKYATPKIAAKWMAQYDSGKEVKPFTFELDTEKTVAD